MDGLCIKFNLSHVMLKIQMLPLSLKVESVGAVGSYMHFQACLFNMQ